MTNEAKRSLCTAIVASERFNIGVLLTLASAAAYYTFRGVGLLEPDIGFAASVSAGLMALSVGIGLFALWRSLATQVSRYPKGSWIAVPLIVVPLLFAVLSSGFFSLIGVGGDEAVRIVMNRGVTALEQNFIAAVSYVDTNAHRGITVLKSTQAKYDTSAAAARDGTTMPSGEGAVTTAYQQVSKALSTSVGEAGDRTRAAKTIEAEITADLASLHALLTDPNLPPSARFARYQTSAPAILQKIEHLADQDISPIVASADAATSSVVPPPLSSRSDVAARQRQALELMQNAQATKLSTGLVGRPAFSPVENCFTVFDAVVATWSHFVPIAVSIALIESTPLFLLILQLVSVGQLPKSAWERSLTIEDAFLAIAALNSLLEAHPIGAFGQGHLNSLGSPPDGRLSIVGDNAAAHSEQRRGANGYARNDR